MKPNYIDIHSHINFPQYDEDRELVLLRMKEKGIWTITIGTSLETSKGAIKLAEDHEGFFACIGMHPADGHGQVFDLEAFEKLITHPKVVGVGECGLDYGRDGIISDERKAQQKKDFQTQIELAVKYDKPLMLHVRNAQEDVLAILKENKNKYGDKLRGNSHFFVSSKAIAQEYLNLGFTCSFTGVITFAKDYDEVVKFMPLESIMSETDAPFVAPIPYRGQRNEPTYVTEVVKRIAELKNAPLEAVSAQLVDNAMRLFSLK